MVLKWKIYRPDSVIAAVITLESMSTQIERVVQKLERHRLRRVNRFDDPGSHPEFGAPLDESAILEFERKYSISLPQGFREFLTRVTSGPVGPGGGLFSLETGASFQRDSVEDDILSVPFPYEMKFTPDEISQWAELIHKADTNLISDEDFDRQYSYIASGTISLCEDCGLIYRLVVTGPTRGMVWTDAEYADGGFIPLGLTFLDWYEEWLDRPF